MDIRKIILEEVNDFDWTEDIQPDLSVGDCITNKLDANKREWIIDMITHTSGGTPVYRVVNESDDFILLNMKTVKQDIRDGIIVLCGPR
tara:strand:+ start:334 stop:600 length:267 start_codon:yes stop_codon:yes gene_type:complete